MATGRLAPELGERGDLAAVLAQVGRLSWTSGAFILDRRDARVSPFVLALAPLMLDLIGKAATFLEPQHFLSDADHYARNLVYEAPDASLSLYALVWLPGQWTPVHDHGSWGVVGVVVTRPRGRRRH